MSSNTAVSWVEAGEGKGNPEEAFVGVPGKQVTVQVDG
jgi:hypothetical protein